MHSRDNKTRSRDNSAKAGSSLNSTDMEPKMQMRDLKKEIYLLASSQMSWKDKKEVENRKVVSLGGKPQKKQRLPLSVARPIMKKQKEREQKMVQERLNTVQFGGKSSNSSSSRRSLGNRRPEDRVLKSSEGIFRNGVLDVKHLLRSGPGSGSGSGSGFLNSSRSRKQDFDFGNNMVGMGGKKGGKGKKNKSKKKGGGKKRH